MEVILQLHSLASSPPTKKPGTHWIENWVRARDSPNGLIEEKIVAPAGRHCLISITDGTWLILFYFPINYLGKIIFKFQSKFLLWIRGSRLRNQYTVRRHNVSSSTLQCVYVCVCVCLCVCRLSLCYVCTTGHSSNVEELSIHCTRENVKTGKEKHTKPNFPVIAAVHLMFTLPFIPFTSFLLSHKGTGLLLSPLVRCWNLQLDTLLLLRLIMFDIVSALVLFILRSL
jgi:hypothetical protein